MSSSNNFPQIDDCSYEDVAEYEKIVKLVEKEISMEEMKKNLLSSNINTLKKQNEVLKVELKKLKYGKEKNETELGLYQREINFLNELVDYMHKSRK